MAGFTLLGFALRLWLALNLPSIQRPDEIFQALEPAHRLWSGFGILSWEWHAGIRSWLFPGFLAGLMALTGRVGADPASYLHPIAAVLSLVSLGVVAAGVALGWRHSRLTGAVLCGVLCACWPALVYFAPKTLAEVQAGNLLVVAAALASAVPARRRVWAMAAIGGLLGLAFCLRFHLAPGIVLVAAWAARRDMRAGWLPLLLGAAVPLAGLGVADTIAWGAPFQSVWGNFRFNLVEAGSEAYGVTPPLWYASKLVEVWGAAVLPVLACFCFGAPAAPLMALLAAVVLVSHSAVAHKEISFVYAALPPAMIVAGIGTARVVIALRGLARPGAVLAGAVGAWLAVAALTGVMAFHYAADEAVGGVLPVWQAARRQADLCGIGLYRVPWVFSGGYTYLNRPVPIFAVPTPEALEAARPALNYLVVEKTLLGIAAPGYAQVTCSRRYCLLRREQGCAEPAETGGGAERLGP